MKRKHTQKKSANRSFDKRSTGYPNELYRKYAIKSIEKPRKFSKPKPRRRRVDRTTMPTH